MNYGIFKGDKYLKKVVFSKAVLWHTRQLSLRSDIIERIRRDGIKKIVFQDDLKGERWIFNPAKVFKTMTMKAVGQEEQYYFPIDICTKEKFAPKPELVFDPVRQLYVEVPPKVDTDPLTGVKRVEVKQKFTNNQISIFDGGDI